MRIVRTIATPWTPYAVTFSHNGSHIAIGGGTWYGEGGLLLVEMDRPAATVLIPWEELPTRHLLLRWGNPAREAQWHARAGTVSGLAFSADDSHLAVATRGAYPHFGPAYVLELERVPKVRAMLLPQRLNSDELFNAAATGMLLLEDGLLIRRDAFSAPPIAVWPFPSDLRLTIDVSGRARTHSGVVLVRGMAITGERCLAHMLGGPDPALPNNLVLSHVTDGSCGVERVGRLGAARVTAITEVPGAEAFITGGQDGELDRWEWVGGWQSKRIHGSLPPQGRGDWKGGVGGYCASSVTGICHLHFATEWVSVDPGGHVTVGSDAKPRRHVDTSRARLAARTGGTSPCRHHCSRRETGRIGESAFSCALGATGLTSRALSWRIQEVRRLAPRYVR